MTTHNTDRPEPERDPASKQFHNPESLRGIFAMIEKNRGRLSVLEYASFGLTHIRSTEASCLTHVLQDIRNDLQQIGELLTGEEESSLDSYACL